MLHLPFFDRFFRPACLSAVALPLGLTAVMALLAVNQPRRAQGVPKQIYSRKKRGEPNLKNSREIKRLYEKAEQRARELETLYQADEQLYRSLRLEQVLQALVDVVVHQLHADKAGVHVWDAAQQRLAVRAAHGFSPEMIARMSVYGPGDGVAGQVFQTGEMIAIEDTSQAPYPAGQIAANEGISSVLSVPITINGQVFGVFGLNYCHPHRFSREEKRLFNALAQRAAIAIENARLYEQAEQAATLEERQRLARELHDSVTQSLYSLVLLSEAARRYAVAGEMDKVEHHLERLGETARQALQEMRLLVYELRPLALAEVGLAGALQQRLNAVEQRAGIQGRLFVENLPALPPHLEEQLYRVAQEALNNTLKHAHASQVALHLRCRANTVELEIQDNGQGFELKADNNGGIGLASMRERAERMGAVLQIDSRPGQGTTVRLRANLAELPLPVMGSQEKL